jgi:hypothetical protein
MPFPDLAAIFLPAALISTGLAFLLEHKRRKKPDETGTYRWGYFLGWFNLCWILITPIVLLGYLRAGRQPTELFGVLLPGVARVTCGWFTLRREKWAFICCTIMGMAGFQGPFHLLSPIGLISIAAIWGAGFPYAKKRWTGGNAWFPKPEPVTFPKELETVDISSEKAGHELLSRAMKMERAGHLMAALAAYQGIARKFAHLPVGRDAQISYEQLQGRMPQGGIVSDPNAAIGTSTDTSSPPPKLC